MQATTKKAKGEQILDNRAKNTATSVREISQTGIKLEINSQDQFTGKFKGQGNSTVTVWLKTDGTSEWENKAVGLTAEGDFIAAWGKGTGKSASPTTTAFEGEVHYTTQSPKLSWLNEGKFRIEGSADTAKGESVGKIFQLK